MVVTPVAVEPPRQRRRAVGMFRVPNPDRTGRLAVGLFERAEVSVSSNSSQWVDCPPIEVSEEIRPRHYRFVRKNLTTTERLDQLKLV